MPNPTGKGGFKKGQVANPKGRPKGLINIKKQCEKLAKKYKLTPADLWWKFMNDPGVKDKDRIACAKYIASYMYGKPVESVDIYHENNPFENILKEIYNKNDLSK